MVSGGATYHILHDDTIGLHPYICHELYRILAGGTQNGKSQRCGKGPEMLVVGITGKVKITVAVIESIFVAGIVKRSAVEPNAPVGSVSGGYCHAAEHRRCEQHGQKNDRAATQFRFHKITSLSICVFSVVFPLFPADNRSIPPYRLDRSGSFYIIINTIRRL